MFLDYGEGIRECHLMKIKLFAGKNEFLIYDLYALSAKSLKVLLEGGYMLTLQILKMLG